MAPTSSPTFVTTSRSTRSEVVPSLDGIRGVALLLVLAHNVSPFDEPRSVSEQVAGLFLNPGWVGVQLFFVLSGYLITGILLDSRKSPSYFRVFMGRRVLRIFPLYYATLFVVYGLLPLVGALPASFVQDQKNQIFLWTYLVNWSGPLGYGVAMLPHFWSLAVEEQFYLVWPLVVRRCTPTRLLGLTLVLAAIAFACRVAIRALGLDSDMAYTFTVCRMDALALGGTVAAALRLEGGAARFMRLRSKLLAASVALLVACAVITSGFARNSAVSQTIGYTLLALAFAALIAGAVGDHLSGARGVTGRFFAHPVLRAFGKYSYGMYVFHPLLNKLVGLPLLVRLGHSRPSVPVGLAYVAAVTGVSFAAAFVSFHAFEEHFLHLKRFFVAEPADSRG